MKRISILLMLALMAVVMPMSVSCDELSEKEEQEEEVTPGDSENGGNEEARETSSRTTQLRML